MTGGLLAFDIATVTGWAYAPSEAVSAWPDMGTLGDPQFARPPLDKISWGSQRFGTLGCDSGLLMHEAQLWFTVQLSRKRPDLVVIEQPLPLGHMTTPVGKRCRVCRRTDHVPLVNADTQRKIGGLIGVFDKVRFEMSLPWDQHGPNSISKHFTGDGTSGGRKQRNIDACLLRGWDVKKDHNAADALALLDYAIACERNLVKERAKFAAAVERAGAAA